MKNQWTETRTYLETKPFKTLIELFYNQHMTTHNKQLQH